jgi:hypothetical protein
MFENFVEEGEDPLEGEGIPDHSKQLGREVDQAPEPIQINLVD